MKSGHQARIKANTTNARPEKAELDSTTRAASRNADSEAVGRRRCPKRSKSKPGATNTKKRRTDSQVAGAATLTVEVDWCPIVGHAVR